MAGVQEFETGSKQQDIVYMIEQGLGRDLVRKMLAARGWELNFCPQSSHKGWA